MCYKNKFNLLWRISWFKIILALYLLTTTKQMIYDTLSKTLRFEKFYHRKKLKRYFVQMTFFW